ncbi:MAG TPA: UDP-N-acetylmuramoyl-L-alanyl-D-glutamate--2,6-diaminopimelate ligase, partial [Vicinamibacteria bacterium]|nr:UDP-N-acetylmuramoyl-L-alanyl-D-glutamate--2,6-diaminopimelate ligase [Vicinamibacteria bacterium]
LATLSAEVLGRPADALTLIGVTGTNGKTTTTYLIDAVLRAAGHKVGLVGTIQYRVGDRLAEAVRTTPESSDLQELFRDMVAAGCDHAVMEVSSHSLALKRVHGLGFRVAVFTNLTRDHLDFHGDMDRYFEAKRILFDTLLRTDGHAVINAADDRAAELRAASRGTVWTFGIERSSGQGPSSLMDDEPPRGVVDHPGADIRAFEVSLSLGGTRFRAHTPVGELLVESPLLGRFNVENLLAALGASLALGLPSAVAIRGLQSVTGVPGRLERVSVGQDFTVIVDYAHTDDALKNLLETVRELKPRRVITVFGCGGDRDRSKRPLMGAVASRLSEAVVVTSDNPRSEPPESIIEEILRGMNGGRKAERHVVVDRRDAIAKAFEMAGPGDAVVIAGKGHETYQVLRDRTVPFDDRQVARDLLARLARSGRA